MYIDISQIMTAEGMNLKFEHQLEFENVSFNGNSIVFDKNVIVSGTVENVGGGEFVLNANVDCSFKTECARCLCEFNVDFPFDIVERFVKNGADEFVTLLEGNKINLTDVVYEHLYMNLPISFICKETCKGLCQECGQNLNEKECNCEDNNIDPRLSALLKFKK